MEIKPKLIIIHGFAGVGKTTIAKRYIDDHPLALNIEGDNLIVMLGQWITHEDQAREYVFALTKSMIATHLKAGKDVIVSYLLTDARHSEAFEQTAKEHNADFYEVLLSVDKEDAVNRLLERGTWGEPGSPPLTENDLPSIHKLYETMDAETAKRPDMITIHPVKDDIESTYQALLEAIKKATSPKNETTIRKILPEDKDWITKVMIDAWGSVVVVASQAFNTLELPGFIGEVDGEKAGILTYFVKDNRCEIVSLNSVIKNRGVGSLLLEKIKEYAKEKKYESIWLDTTNDNIDALKFYQKRGFRITKVYPDEIDKVRKLKPQIPEIGEYGIPIKDALELEYSVSDT